jgi:ribulose-5-phosphate 4-epimerase/fuculose-1-phosphate aldolase
MHDEGVIKFAVDHRHEPLEPRRFGETACRLIAWREILTRIGLIGQAPDRYGGLGYGNVSARVGPPGAPRGRRSFLISGTQTSGKAAIGLADFCVVAAYDPVSHRLTSHGATLPSSESMTHGAVYDLGAHVRFVFHAHSPTLWQRRELLRLPTSDPRVAYGTAEMAREVWRLNQETALSEVQILAMGGHEDGVIVFGRSAEEAGQVLLRHLARAFEAQCGGR